MRELIGASRVWGLICCGMLWSCSAADRPTGSAGIEQRDADHNPGPLSGGAGTTSTQAVAMTAAALNATDTITLTASQDATVAASMPNQNFGTTTTLDYNRTLVQFDLASLISAVGPNDYITSARLEMTLTNDLQRLTGRIRTVSAHRVTSAWTEAGATWSCAIDSNTSNPAQDCSGSTRWSMTTAPNSWVEPASTTLVVQPAQTGVVAFDLTTDVRGFVANTFTNNGWLLKTTPTTELAAFASRQTATPPRLVVSVRRCTPAQCNDNNSCTVDSCSPIGVCVNAVAANGTSCSDGNACSQSDVCQAGVCVGQNFVTCTASDSCHRAGVCNPSTGTCSNPVVANGTSCSDGNTCTTGDQCIAGACTPNGNAANGTSCSDGSACTSADSCAAGVCVGHNPVVCTASDQCHVAGTCNPLNGACSNPLATDGTACNDTNPCTQSESCQAGACTGGSPVVCMASDACHVGGACDPGTGLCSNPIAPNGTPCNDGNACTQSDQCNAGACVAGAPVTCTPVDGCHPASCNPSTGTCSATSACALYGVAGISGTAGDGLELTPGLLENNPPTPNNQLGAFGSAITYTGVGDLYLATPDRGPADGATSYTDRYYLFSLSLSGGVVTPALVGAATLNQGPGVTFVGTATAFDATNSPASRRLDPEGVRVSPTGTFYVSDEYGPFLYEFGSSGNRVRTYSIPSKFSIATPGANELPPNNTSGRQTNRGMEGLAITPDGSKLYGIMQNALIQDGALNGSNSRIGLNNRILEVDTVTGNTREFLYPLSNAAYGVNELLAINDHQFLAIERDGNAGTSAAFKRLMLVDISGATDISGIASLPTSGTPAGVTPVTKRPFLDLLSAEFGLAGASFPEKIEGLAFGPDRPDGKHVLVVTNDNDFNDVSSNFYVFTVDPSALPGYVAQQATFTSACASVSCGAPAQCYDQGSCNPASATCSQPPSVEGAACGTGQTCDGTGHCNTCVTANDCPGTDGECGGRTCTSGVCGMSFAPAGTACGTSQVCDGAGNCSAHIVITEVESNNDPVGDWIELYNADASSVDISGYLLGDNSNARLTIPAGTIVAAGGYVAFVTDGTSGGLPNAFGLGAADSARLFSPTGVLLDSYTWTAHASTTYGRCPTVSSGFVTTGWPTKGAANGCSMPNIKVNEVESNSDPVGDWIELTNLGTMAVNIGGFLLADDSTARLTIPAGTILPAGGYVAFVTDGVSGGLPNAFGLGGADQARFFHPDGTSLIDSTSWSSHATNTWGRCPNGTGAFGARVTSTFGAANVCP